MNDLASGVPSIGYERRGEQKQTTSRPYTIALESHIVPVIGYRNLI